MTRNTVLIFEFLHSCRVTALLWSQKVFISIKGIYYQAEVMGQLITWLVPYQFAHDVSEQCAFIILMKGSKMTLLKCNAIITGDYFFRIVDTWPILSVFYLEFYTCIYCFLHDPSSVSFSTQQMLTTGSWQRSQRCTPHSWGL